MTVSLSVPRLGDRMSSIGRGLTGRIAALSLVVLATLAGVATYAWMANLVPAYFGTRGWMTALLVADLVIAMALAATLAGRITEIWLDRRRGAAGSRLHMRLVLLCSVFTVMPTLIVAIIMATPLAKFTIAAVTGSASNRNEATDTVRSTMLRVSSAFELMPRSTKRCTRAPAIQPAEAIAPRMPM